MNRFSIEIAVESSVRLDDELRELSVDDVLVVGIHRIVQLVAQARKVNAAIDGDGG